MHTWNVIFLLDKNPPSKILLLKRGPNRTFAPNLYTGIGGKVEANETLLESAYRELQEETGITEVKLKHFAKVVIDNQDRLHYFWGLYTQTNLPKSNEGTLKWTTTKTLLQKPIIPTTLEMLKHWQSQNFSTQPFTLYIETITQENGIKKVKTIPIIDKNLQKV